MKCTICGKATSHGMLLCRPCKAALKRARQLTVQDVPQRPARRPRRGVRHEAPAEPSTGIDALRRPIRSDRAARLLLGTVAIAALVGAAYVAAREFVGRAAIAPVAPSHVTQPHVSDSIPVADAASRDVMSASLPAPPTSPELTSSPPLRPSVGSLVRAASAAPASPAVAAPRNTSEARGPEQAVAPGATYPPLDSFGPLAEVQKPAPPPPAPIPRPAPPPDRWQAMSDALARCASEGGFTGFICDQRVRLASCDGYWGQVAQCPNPPENPR